VTSAKVVQSTSTSFAVDWVSPDIRAEGANGAPIDSYTVVVASPVKEVQDIYFTDGAFTNQVKLGFVKGGNTFMTRCLSQTATVSEMEIKLEELPYIDDVTVT
jgi:hypothetical protein